MKLVVCIVHNRDKARVCDDLVAGGFKFTIIASTGGFLRDGNSTLLIGCESDQIDALMALVETNCGTREQMLNAVPFDAGAAGAFLASPVKVPVGGAVVFVLPVERFERY